MANFTVDPSVLSQKATQINQYADEYDSISTQLQQAATSMGAAYDSADNRKFIERMEACAKDLKLMSDKLRSASTTLKGQSSLYVDQETANTQQASSLPG